MTYSLVGSGNVDKAAIFNVEGTSVWASTTGFTVSFSTPYGPHRNQGQHMIGASTTIKDLMRRHASKSTKLAADVGS